ncbi:hypothetical protein [Palleronia rufa]|uniref:hypothetical protein n=1 Tax=Palleronia rufa TaxID=1530186 RepID=UPI001378E4C7|nr:hypothetical protein [Palleronia rufa]
MTRITAFSALLVFLAACQTGGPTAREITSVDEPETIENPSDGFDNEIEAE